MIAGAGADTRHALWEGQPVKHVYSGTGMDAVQVWPVEVWVPITATDTLGARNRARAAATDRGIDWATATRLPLGFDCSTASSLSYFLFSWEKLQEVQIRNTSNVSNWNLAFYGCYALTSIPAVDASSAVSFGQVFDGCSSLTSIGMYGQRVSFTIVGTKLAAPALNALFTQLGQAQSGATLTITGTPGAASCDRTIATAKGWTITG